MDTHNKEIFLDKKGIKIQKAIEKLKLPNNQELIRNIVNSEKILKESKSMKEKDKKKAKEKDKKKKLKW